LAGSGSTVPTSLTTFHRSGRSREFFFASFFLTAKIAAAIIHTKKQTQVNNKEDMHHALTNGYSDKT
jgi:hypothetical protein